MRRTIPLLLFALQGCTLPIVIGGQDPMSPAVEAPAPPPAPPLTVFLAQPVERTEIMQVATAIEEAHLSTPPPIPAPVPVMLTKTAPPPKDPTAHQIVTQAQQAALVQPTARGYFAGSAMHRFTWMPGKLHVIYVSPASATKIALPPGEALAAKLALDPEAWDVGHATVGEEPYTQDIIFLRPLGEKGEVDVAILTKSGHSFDVHLVSGKIGMFAVTFEVPPLVRIEPESPLQRGVR